MDILPLFWKRLIFYRDQRHYQQVVAALAETMRLMVEIDAAIPSSVSDIARTSNIFDEPTRRFAGDIKVSYNFYQ